MQLPNYLWLTLWMTVLLDKTTASVGEQRSTAEPYAPYHVECGAEPLLRPATSLSANETSYITSRKALADEALSTWLKKTWQSSVSFSDCKLPTLALALSGGGPKAGLLAAGVVQGLDSRDTSNTVSGLLQSMTYMSALSGGSLTLAGVMGNDFAEVSALRSSLWDATYQSFGALALKNNATIRRDIAAKTAAGYPTTLDDIYGRLLGYDFIGGSDGADGLTWSSVVGQPEFIAHRAPFPIITQTNADVMDGQCIPSSTGPIWEVSPYEFGAWQSDVHAFVPTKYLGTTLKDGKAKSSAACTQGFDNLGLFVGMSADILVSSVSSNCTVVASSNSSTGAFIEEFLAIASPSLPDVPYGVIPNPFYEYAPSTAVNNQTALYMLDGGLSGQGIPIFPFLQPERKVDVIFVADDESSTAVNTTDGLALHATYSDARRQGLSWMPPVPENHTYTVGKLVSRASFFGCHDTSVATIIYMPDTTATLDSDETFSFTPSAIDTLIQAGTDMVTQSNNTEWPMCVACAVMHKSITDLPSACTACLQKYCWIRQDKVEREDESGLISRAIMKIFG